MALQDLLAPWVDTIVVEAGGEPVLVIDRDQVAGTRLLTEASALVAAADVGRDCGRAGGRRLRPRRRPRLRLAAAALTGAPTFAGLTRGG